MAGSKIITTQDDRFPVKPIIVFLTLTYLLMMQQDLMLLFK
jgi:hypothetical protein